MKAFLLAFVIGALASLAHATDFEDQAYIDQLTQGGIDGIKQTAQKIHGTGETSTEVLDVAAEVLLQRYPTASINDVDTLAWVAKALGNSRNPRYYTTLKEVVDSNAQKKLRKHAKKALSLVGGPSGDQYVKGTLNLSALQNFQQTGNAKGSAAYTSNQASTPAHKALSAIRTIATGNEVAHEYFERGGRFQRVVLVNTEPVTLFKAAKLARENNVDAFAMVEGSGPVYHRFTFRVTLATARLKIVTGAGKVVYDHTTVLNSSVGKVIGSQRNLSNNDVLNMLGEAVWTDLMKAMGSANSSAAKSTYSNASNSRDTVMRAQQCLNSSGYNPGVADGFAGRKTEDALRQFQSDQRLETTGRLNKDTLALLEQLCDGSAVASRPLSEATGNSLTPVESGFTRSPAAASMVEPRSDAVSYSPGNSRDSAQVIGGPAEVYSKPSPFGKILAVLPNGAQITVININGEWVEIKAGSKVGYLYKDLTNLVN